MTSRTRRRFLAEGAALAAISTAAWEVVAAESPEARPSATDLFAADVVREVVRSMPDGNVVLSPVSLQSALAMAAVGARGETRERLQSALGLSSLEPADIHAHVASPMLQAARAVFVRGLPIEPAYAKAVSDGLYADVRELPEDVGEAVRTVNDWADEATHHRIRHLYDHLPAGPLLLTDAVYLKFRWQHPFDAAKTQDRPFHRTAGGAVSVPMMATSLAARAGKCRAGTFVQLRFEDVDGGVDLVLPRKGLSAEEALDITLRSGPDFFPDSAWRDYYTEVDLTLPRLELRSSLSLADAASRAGLAAVFEHADLSGISPALADSPLGAILQQAWLKADEQGVEAAAVTAVGITGSTMPKRPPLKLVFDRPFALVIRDRNVLFAAVVRDPSIPA